MDFSSAEIAAFERLLALALEEDLPNAGDLTCRALIPSDLQGCVVLVARTDGVTAGLPAVHSIFQQADRGMVIELLTNDGTAVHPGTRLAAIRGRMTGILIVERIALNFLQHLSGIATLTRRYVDRVAGLPVKILDTRKTTPGWRVLEKYAVRCGGGHNHRMSLGDGILIKDNHLAALNIADSRLPIVEALRRARTAFPNTPVTIEVDTLDQLEAVLRESPDIILLDNMTTDQMREAVRRRNAIAPNVLLEASGGVTLSTVRAIAETGVDRISVGALTHSAPALDIGLDYQT